MGMLRKLERVKQRQLAKEAKPTFGLPPGMYEAFPGEELVRGDRLGLPEDIHRNIDYFTRELLRQWMAKPDKDTVRYLGMLAILHDDLEGAYTYLLPMEEGIVHLKKLASDNGLIYVDSFDDDIRQPVPGHIHPLPVYVFVDVTGVRNVGIFFMDKAVQPLRGDETPESL